MIAGLGLLRGNETSIFPRLSLILLQILADCIQIAVETSGVIVTGLPDFGNDGSSIIVVLLHQFGSPGSLRSLGSGFEYIASQRCKTAETSVPLQPLMSSTPPA